MKNLLLAVLLICLMPALPIMSEPIPSLEDSFNQLLQKMVNSLSRLKEQRIKIDALEKALKQAKASSQKSSKLAKKLQKELTVALAEQQELEQTISMLRDKSEKVSRLLKDVETTLNANEDAHLANLKKIENAHKAELAAARIGGWLKGLAGIAIGGGITFLILTLVK
jgi:ABC-type transporter Mla subunit MlaD